MRFITAAIFGVLLLACAVSSSPWETKSAFDRGSEDYTEPRTYTALKNFFRPVYNWFNKELPHKTPKDLVTDIKDTATDVKDWADNNYIIQTAKNAIQPVHQWIKDTGNTLKGKTFREIYDDSKDFASRVDDTVGGWIERTG